MTTKVHILFCPTKRMPVFNFCGEENVFLLPDFYNELSGNTPWRFISSTVSSNLAYHSAPKRRISGSRKNL